MYASSKYFAKNHESNKEGRSSNSNRLGKYIFIFSLIFILLVFVFFYGVTVGKYKYWPHDTLDTAKDAVGTFIETGTISPKNLLVRTPTQGIGAVTIPRPNLVAKGYRVFMGWDEGARSYAAWLFDETGTKLHTWTINYYTLDPDGPRNKSDMPHGFRVLRDGSIIVNFDWGDVLGRLDACSKPIWAKNGIYHHEIGEAENGSMWAWRGEGTAYSHIQFLVNFDPQSGETITEISFLDEIVRLNNRQARLFSVGDNFSPLHFDQNPADRDDFFHPNDIDVLHSDIADNFPQFSPGDLLISLRNLHMIAVVDPSTKQVKWTAYGPWRYQHDPDFTADGKISVYNNRIRNNDKERGIDRSEITKIDPTTRALSSELKEGGLEFSSIVMGTHQYLPNGNVLIVVPKEGRVLEAAPNGALVFEFNNVFSDTYNGHIENAQFVSKDYFDSLPKCLMR